MYKYFINHLKTLLLPCIGFSMAVGCLSAIIVTAFKLAAEWVLHSSETVYHAIRSNPLLLPLLIAGAALLGLVASLILSHTHSCRGGGIPTSVAAIRGMLRFRWWASILVLPFSALLSFFCGLPLGTEGPCVQMGTAIGDGVTQCMGKKTHQGWRRYFMTGGAAAGFSLATASPITAILFSMEELHKYFSPMLLTVAALSVIFSQFTVQLLSVFGITTTGLFHLPNIPALEPHLLYAPLVIGAVCGIASILFTRCYHLTDKLMHRLLSKISVKIVFPLLFACISLIGFFFSDTLGNGHALMDRLLSTRAAWYLLILLFLIRAVSMMSANTAGVTGGIFLPTLALGAILGSLCAERMIAWGWIAEDHYTFMVVLGIAAFLGATSRIPLTACVFAIEALGAFHNVLPLIIATTVAFLVVEASGLEDFTDTVIHAKLRSIHREKTKTVIEVSLTVGAHAFVLGKELRDILWPHACAVVSLDRADGNKNLPGIAMGDVLTVHYKTYDPAATAEELTALVGEQSEEVQRIMNPSLSL